MKKSIALILTILYLASTTGATVYLHYCMDKLVEQSLWHSEKAQCSHCGMDKNKQEKGCCKNEHKQGKLNDNHYAPDFTFQPLKLSCISVPTTFFEIQVDPVSSLSEENPTSNAPPRSGDIAVYKRNCVFRI